MHGPGLPPRAPCLQTPQTGPEVSKAKVSVAQAMELEWASWKPLPGVGPGLRGSTSCGLGPEDWERAHGGTLGGAQGQRKAIPLLTAVPVQESLSQRVLGLRTQSLTNISVVSFALPG